VVITSMNENYRMGNMIPSLIYDEVKKTTLVFNSIFFSLVYRELHSKVDSLLKDGIYLAIDSWMVKEVGDGTIFNKIFILVFWL
jgi:hypothetical protein